MGYFRHQAQLRPPRTFPLVGHSIDFGQHSFQQGFGRGRGDARALKLADYAALPVDLGAHPLDFGSEVVEVWHGRPQDGRLTMNESRTLLKPLRIGVPLTEHPIGLPPYSSIGYGLSLRMGQADQAVRPQM